MSVTIKLNKCLVISVVDVKASSNLNRDYLQFFVFLLACCCNTDLCNDETFVKNCLAPPDTANTTTSPNNTTTNTIKTTTINNNTTSTSNTTTITNTTVKTNETSKNNTNKTHDNSATVPCTSNLCVTLSIAFVVIKLVIN